MNGHAWQEYIPELDTLGVLGAADVEAVGVEHDGTGSSTFSFSSSSRSSLPSRVSSLISDTGSALVEGIGSVVSVEGVSSELGFEPCTSMCTL